MNDNPDIHDREESRGLRGSVIRFLHKGYGRENAITLKSIARVAGRRENDRELHAAIAYLVDSGYATKQQRVKVYTDDESIFDYRCTPKGQQLVERYIDDVAVEL